MIELTFNANGITLSAREAVSVLGKIAPRLATEARREMVTAVRPAIAQITARIPTLPMSGWGHRGRTSWTVRDPKTAVRAEFTKPRKLTADQFPLLTLVQPTAAGAIYDLAATAQPAGRDRAGRLRNARQNQVFVANLNRYATGQPRSRAMWPGTLAALPEIESALRDTVRRMEETLNRELG